MAYWYFGNGKLKPFQMPCASSPVCSSNCADYSYVVLSCSKNFFRNLWLREKGFCLCISPVLPMMWPDPQPPLSPHLPSLRLPSPQQGNCGHPNSGGKVHRPPHTTHQVTPPGCRLVVGVQQNQEKNFCFVIYTLSFEGLHQSISFCLD